MARLVFDRRDEVMRALYDTTLSTEGDADIWAQMGGTYKRYTDFYRDAIVVGLEVGGQLAGGMLFLDGVVHLGIYAPHRAVWARMLRPMLQVGFDRFGPRLLARVHEKNARARRFVERVGCHERRTRNGYVEYDVIQKDMRYVDHL